MFACLFPAAAALAIDQPISGAKLQLTDKGIDKEKLLFLSKDPAFLFPAIGGPDDPQVVGAVVDVVPQPVSGGGTLTMPAGAGKPGWRVKTGNHPSFTFDNNQAPDGISGVRVLALKQGKQIKLLAKSLGGVNLASFYNGVAIRITIGNLRSCALFGPGTIKRLDAERFQASNAPASALADCSDLSIGLSESCGTSPACGGVCPGDAVCAPEFGSECRCISPLAPCGGTAPVCNGTCGVGEECAAVGPAFPSCVCIPTGATPCGSPGAPVCGGACSADTVCRPVYGLAVFGTPLGCTCRPPGPCGAGLGVDCDAGTACGPSPFPPMGSSACLPMYCGGTYPTCGGACGDGGECSAFNEPAGSYTACLCAAPGPCDGACGGLQCPGGEVCTRTSGSCTCQ